MMVVPRVVRSSVVGFGAVLGAYESLTESHALTFQKLKLKRKKAVSCEPGGACGSEARGSSSPVFTQICGGLHKHLLEITEKNTAWCPQTEASRGQQSGVRTTATTLWERLLQDGFAVPFNDFLIFLIKKTEFLRKMTPFLIKIIKIHQKNHY